MLQLVRIHDGELRTLPESFGQLQSLKELLINGNQLTTLPEAFGALNPSRS